MLCQVPSIVTHTAAALALTAACGAVGLGVYALSSAYVLLVRSRLTAEHHVISRHFPAAPA
ncbi:hypothetical protein K523DRAFT_359223 [Schizophyllum commune Tattone D]|nr:hypothetical protein K523DRAFT_359223 [Schizophyllum commune Tattone D]